LVFRLLLTVCILPSLVIPSVPEPTVMQLPEYVLESLGNYDYFLNFLEEVEEGNLDTLSAAQLKSTAQLIAFFAQQVTLSPSAVDCALLENDTYALACAWDVWNPAEGAILLPAVQRGDADIVLCKRGRKHRHPIQHYIKKHRKAIIIGIVVVAAVVVGVAVASAGTAAAAGIRTVGGIRTQLPTTNHLLFVL
jgi:hypothetical protein